MSDEPKAVTARGELDARYLKNGLVTLIIPMRPKLAELIGFIVAQWGGFEVRMDAFIDGFHKAMRKDPPENWKRLPFRKRKELFKATYREYLPEVGWGDEIAPLDNICATAADLHWRRNVIVHGFYRYHLPATYKGPEDDVHMTAYGVHNKRDVEIELSEETLAKIFHDIAHLNGDLMSRMARRGASIDNPEMLVEDKWFLQDQEHGSFQTVPIPNRS
ncbi:MAG TPA: hypothetical protein VJR87_04560 [Allosphingosinicella sp.]|nr:hypothetical protein [Allosphingosinicella sp.]